jgi:hypothetical protein
LRTLGTSLLSSGTLLLGLAGLEKVLLFLAVNAKASTNQMEAVINLTPPYIWTITNVTFWGGLALVVIGLFLFFTKEKAGM